MPRSISLALSASILASVNISPTTALLDNGARWGAVISTSLSAGVVRPASSFGRLCRREIAGAKSHAGGDADAVIGIGAVEMSHLALHDLRRHAIHRGPDVVEQLLLLLGAHQPKQVAGLTVVVVAVAVVVAVCVTRNRKRRLLDTDVLHRPAHRVGFVIGVR